MRKKIMTLMMGALLLLTACGQTGNSSASTMLPVAAVQSVVQAVTPMEDKMQEDVDSLLVGEDTEEAEPAGDEETPKPTKDAATPSGKTEETLSTPAGEEQPDVPEQPTTPEQPVTPEPAPMSRAAVRRSSWTHPCSPIRLRRTLPTLWPTSPMRGTPAGAMCGEPMGKF